MSAHGDQPIPQDVQAIRYALYRLELTDDDDQVRLSQLVDATTLDAVTIEEAMSSLERTTPVRAVRQGGTGRDLSWKVV